MQCSNEVRFTPAVVGMMAFLEPFRPWLEFVLGGPWPETLTFDLEVPFGAAVADELLCGVALDQKCLASAVPLRPLIERWALPPAMSPRVALEPSRTRGPLITARELAWDPHWMETPVALWLRGLRHAVVAVNIPYVTHRDGPTSENGHWLLVNRNEVAVALPLLRQALRHQPKTVDVVGGVPLSLPEQGHDWSDVVLDPSLVSLVREDFEGFLAREPWFRRHRLPFRRGYLLYGPPGNGKTSIVRVMACHPQVEAHSLNFSNQSLDNDAMTFLFESAGRTAPALVIFEDLDRLYGTGTNRDNLTKVTLQHLLNCLDGLGSHEGVIVVATANDPTVLDPAILRRPGRFDRAVPCRPPTEELRGEYLRRLSVKPLDPAALLEVGRQTDGLSFAQLREAFILAGHLAYQRGGERIDGAGLLEAVRLVRGEGQVVGARLDGRGMGFELPARAL